MINKVGKGNRRQLACRKQLEADGWLVYSAIRVKYHDIDIFGLWDIIAYKITGPPTAYCALVKVNAVIKLIQVKSNKCDAETRRKIDEFAVDGEIVKKEIWIYKDYSREGPKIEEVG